MQQPSSARLPEHASQFRTLPQYQYQLKRITGKLVRIRPIVRELNDSNTLEPEVDDVWKVMHVGVHDGAWLHNLRTNHGMRIAWDYFCDLQQDTSRQCAAILVMTSQTFMRGNQLWPAHTCSNDSNRTATKGSGNI